MISAAINIPYTFYSLLIVTPKALVNGCTTGGAGVAPSIVGRAPA